MKKLNKKDLLYIIITIIVFISTITIIYTKNFLHTEITLLNKEISTIEYLRTLYYSNFNLFPDFAFNIGNGQNIYYLAEYGLLSPITLVSYLLPFLSIKTYLTIITIISPIISTILLYRFFHKQKYSSEICFLISILFILSTTIIFTTYTSPLTSSYLVFLILGLYGVDKVFKEKKGNLLTIALFLMIMTSYKESISGIICILIYSIYKYLKHMNTITIKTLFKRIIAIILPIIVALLCSSILILPTIISIPESINNKEITLNLSLGIVLLIVSIINYIKKEKTSIFLSLTVIILTIISILNNYNLLSYIPLFLIIIIEFLNNIINKKLNIKPLTIISLIIISIIYLIEQNNILLIETLLLIIVISIYYKYSNKYLLIIPICLYMLITQSLINNLNIQKELSIIENNNIVELLNKIPKENNIYRTSINIDNTYYSNINYYNSNILTNNRNTLYEELNNNILFNKGNNNIIDYLLNSNKYIISDTSSIQGYSIISNIDNINLYKNNNVLPIGFATSNIMSYEDFTKLNKLTKQETLLNVIIADTETNNNFIPNTKEIDLSIKDILKGDNIYHLDNGIFINAQEKTTIEYELPEKYQNKILFISFTVQNSRNNQLIKINNNEKYISKSNQVLEFICQQKDQEKLILTFTEGQYYISNLQTYILDYAHLETYSSNVDPFIIEPHNTKDDKIIGTIDVSKDSYFMLTIPYEKGFNILLDNQLIEYEKVDETYIGFPITEGLHSIEITYTVPYKHLAYLLSILGIISFITITYFESKRQFN